MGSRWWHLHDPGGRLVARHPRRGRHRARGHRAGAASHTRFGHGRLVRRRRGCRGPAGDDVAVRDAGHGGVGRCDAAARPADAASHDPADGRIEAAVPRAWRASAAATLRAPREPGRSPVNGRAESGAGYPTRPPRARVIVDNDFAGDPDDLFQLAHHLLSPSVEIPFVIASRLPAVPYGEHIGSVDRGVSVVAALLEQMKIDVPVLRGTEQDRTDASPVRSEASDAIVAEALRDDTDLPLFLVLGGGLTELANAYLTEPAIADRLTAVWIGGAGYSATEPAEPSMFGAEYNMNIDVPSAQVVFESAIPLWQVPVDAYRRCLVSWAELRQRVGSLGGFGAHLMSALDGFADLLHEHGMNLGETYILGDSP